MSEELNSIPVPQPVKHPEKEAPALPKRLFWDMRFDEIDWLANHKTIIGRVMERGNDNEFAELIRFYGLEYVLNTIKTELSYLPNYAIPRVCDYFKLKEEELRCYRRPQSRRGLWN